MNKPTQKPRLIIQIFFLIFTAIGFFNYFQFTMMIILAATLLTGAFYCGWICPYGTIQDIFSKLGRRLNIPQFKMPTAIQKYLLFSRYLLFIAFNLFTINFLFQVLNYDPRNAFISILLGSVPSYISIMVFMSFTLIGLFFERPFCNYLCIEGARYGLLSALRIVTISRNADTCVNCKKCDKACPMNILVSKATQMHSPQCISCMTCIDTCPVKDTLSYRLVRFNWKNKAYYASILIVIIGMISGHIVYGRLSGNELLPINTSAIDTLFDSNNETDLNNMESDSQTEILESSTDRSFTDWTERGHHGQTGSFYGNDTVSLANTEVDASGISDGTYEGSGIGFRGTITVKVSVEDELITEIEVIENRDDMKWFNRAWSQIYSAIINDQTVDVDIVSGATYSSAGIISAIQDALNQNKL